MAHWTNHVSRAFGAVAHTPFPGPLQRLINRTYVRLMHVDLTGFAPFESYPTLNALFTRKLIQPRSFDPAPAIVNSPADALISELGQLRGDTLLQIKGMEYSANRLLTEQAARRHRVIDGTFLNFYLSPTDYHGYHAPTALQVLKLIHIPGKLYSVNQASAQKRKNLFIENERVVMECASQTGHILYLVFIGATNVGSINFDFEPALRTNTSSRAVREYSYADKWLAKGECLGGFQMGSSIVLIAEKDFLEINSSRFQKVRFGDSVARVVSL